jgi:hypothetical protein
MATTTLSREPAGHGLPHSVGYPESVQKCGAGKKTVVMMSLGWPHRLNSIRVAQRAWAAVVLMAGNSQQREIFWPKEAGA